MDGRSHRSLDLGNGCKVSVRRGGIVAKVGVEDSAPGRVVTKPMVTGMVDVLCEICPADIPPLSVWSFLLHNAKRATESDSWRGIGGLVLGGGGVAKVAWPRRPTPLGPRSSGRHNVLVDRGARVLDNLVAFEVPRCVRVCVHTMYPIRCRPRKRCWHRFGSHFEEIEKKKKISRGNAGMLCSWGTSRTNRVAVVSCSRCPFGRTGSSCGCPAQCSFPSQCCFLCLLIFVFHLHLSFFTISFARPFHLCLLVGAQFALVPLNNLADSNATPFPVPASAGTMICPMNDGWCFNPGETVDGTPVVRPQ